MKRIFFLALLIPLCLGFSAKAAFALDGACNPEVMDMMKHQADAIRARDKANANQIRKRPEPVEGLTCFDQQLKLTAHLGSFFSDKKIPLSAGISGGFCGMLASLSGELTGTLKSRLGEVVTPSLGVMMGNFLNSLFSHLAFLNDFLGSLSFSICAPTVSLPTIPIPMFHLPGPLGACLPFPALGGGNLGGQSFGGQCVGMTMPTISCDNIKKLWGGNGTLSVEGGGPEPGTPYTSLRDLLSGAPPGVGVDFRAQLNNNSALLSRALADLNTLSAPGGISSWPETPVFPPNASTSTIIDSM